MKDTRTVFVGIDWAREAHQACVLDADGQELGNRGFEHSGRGLAEMAEWILALSGSEPQDVAVAIETPHGPVVEGMQEHGFEVCSLNPKQLDRFRDRYFPAGQKDDRRDARVLAGSLRTDPDAFRRLQIPADAVLELRECSRDAEDLTREQTRLTHRIRQQLWRYYPQLLDLGEVGEGWILDLWQAAPTPQRARRLRMSRIEKILTRNRIRRIDAAEVKAILSREALKVAAGTERAAQASIGRSIERLRLVKRQLRDARARIEALIETVDIEVGAGQRASNVLRSIPGVGPIVLGTLLSEAFDPITRWDYRSLRAICGVAPVTQRSGKSIIVKRRHAANRRLRNAVWHWARVAIQRDPQSRAKYDALRERGHRHARALRGVADRLLYVACAMLRDGTLYQPDRPSASCEAA